MSEPPRKTLSIKTKLPSSIDNSEVLSRTTTRTGKRIIKREQVDKAILAKPKKRSTSANTKKRKLAPKKPLISPSQLRMDNLNLSLNNFEVWHAYRPLALGIEREIFQYIAKHHISASKRIVQKLLKLHTQQTSYKQQLSLDQQRYHLDGSVFNL